MKSLIPALKGETLKTGPKKVPKIVLIKTPQIQIWAETIKTPLDNSELMSIDPASSKPRKMADNPSQTNQYETGNVGEIQLLIADKAEDLAKNPKSGANLLCITDIWFN